MIGATGRQGGVGLGAKSGRREAEADSDGGSDDWGCWKVSLPGSARCGSSGDNLGHRKTGFGAKATSSQAKADSGEDSSDWGHWKGEPGAKHRGSEAKADDDSDDWGHWKGRLEAKPDNDDDSDDWGHAKGGPRAKVSLQGSAKRQQVNTHAFAKRPRFIGDQGYVERDDAEDRSRALAAQQRLAAVEASSTHRDSHRCWLDKKYKKRTEKRMAKLEKDMQRRGAT